ncbi:MAG: DUF4115 domain-containing protein [Deltaproteobacteria bacterium]|nr:DUF4115 domain-containing protein [Deltaproteobacteria bacterium]MBW1993858.1 DUF4115 domain-containing protein [Deltaproteobacteria bacterium]MBW2151479.1 DUF4115 domain-containing protein [Deltaproteobacteria bacterium]
MYNEKKSLSFGRYLKTLRLEKGISLKEVANETRIGMETLILIENEDLGKLPAEVFTRGFLRAYAKAIDANGDEVIRRYITDIQAFRDTERFETDLKKATSRFWSRIIFSFGALGCIIAISIYVLSGSSTRMPSPSEQSQHQVLETVHQESRAGDERQEPKSRPVEPTADRLRLKVKAIKKTWIKVIVDSRDAKQYHLNPGDHLEIEAESGFNLLIGDAKGVELTLGDKPVRVFGKDNQVVTVQIP